MIAVLFGILGVIFYYYAINYINVNDNLNLNRVDMKIIIIIFISTLLLYNKYKVSTDFIFLEYLSLYLIISAYVDKATLCVYSSFNYLTMLISILYLVLKSNSLDLILIGVNVIIYIIISMVLMKMNYYSNGDHEVFIAIAPYVAAIYSDSFILIALIFNMLISNLVITITNLKYLKKNKFIKKIAYVPSIAFSTILILLIR